MSVTFSVRDAPSHKEQVACFCDYDGVFSQGCYACKGTGLREERVPDGEPTLNLANGNAGAILRLLGIEGEDCYAGEIEASGIPAVRRRIFVLRNRQDDRSSATRDTVEERGPTRAGVNEDGLACITTGPRMISFGIDDEYVLEKLNRLDALLAEAQRLGTALLWG